MTTLFKPTRPYRLPPNPEIIHRENKPYLRVKDRGKTAVYPLSEDGTQYLKPAAKWVADVRFADGTRKRVRLSSNRDAAAIMLAELLKGIENEKAGVFDRTAVHRKRPLTAHLDDWKASLNACGRDEEYIALKLTRVRAAFDGCEFAFSHHLAADRLETFLHDLRLKEGRSIQTSNDWLQAVRQFCRWMVSNGRIDRDPFARLKPGNARVDPRRRRGEFTPEEIGKLFAIILESKTSFRSLSGPDRRMLYRVALGTGYRAAELAALVPIYFDLDSVPPVVILPAEFTKNRKTAAQPIADELAAELRTFLQGRAMKEPLWPGTWCQRSADMLKIDLTAAGIPVDVDGPEGVEVRDFHALRNCYISDVIRTGADLKQSMTLARHSDPRLTAGRYARTRLFDLGAVVNKLPTVTLSDLVPAALQMTGTDRFCAAKGTAKSGYERFRLRMVEETNADDEPDLKSNKPLEIQGFEGKRERLGTIETERGGFEHPVKSP